jgi:hypothetical protein
MMEAFQQEFVSGNLHINQAENATPLARQPVFALREMLMCYTCGLPLYEQRLAEARMLLEKCAKGARPDENFYNSLILDQGVEAWEMLKEARNFLVHKEEQGALR